jgi:hypothetical protein
MIAAQGGIFGWVAPSAALLAALEEATETHELTGMNS